MTSCSLPLASPGGCQVSCGEQVFANVKIIILYVDRLFWTGTNALPTEKTFGYVIPYGDWSWMLSLQNQGLKTLKGDVILHKAIYRLTPFLR
jgi:hypothetical protein